VQIYCDFSGYSRHRASGWASAAGVRADSGQLQRPPYFATSAPSAFWRRWHISLSSWLRDYLYIPLGGNRHGGAQTHRNLLVVMLLGGLWHGASWNFVLWGLFHGVILVIYRALGADAGHKSSGAKRPAALVTAGRVGVMFTLAVVGWVLFRCQTVDQVVYFFTHAGVGTSAQTGEFAFTLAYFTVPLLLMQAAQHVTRDLLVAVRLPTLSRAVVYAAMFTGIAVFGVRESVEFIYFQF
jgi:alginate O-acetyltransferase complex protein AlgI